MQASTYQDVISRAKQLGRDLDLDLLFRTYLFIPRKLLRDTVRELGRGLDGKLLDVGCGTQQYRKFLRCDEYIGIDWSAEKRPTVVADVTQIPFQERSFDSALCMEVLEHLPEPGRCLAEIRRVVKPDGMVLFTVPMTVHTHSEPHDFYRYTEYGLRYLLDKHGFEIMTLRRLGGMVSVMASRCINLGCEVVSERLDRSALRGLRRLLVTPVAAGGSLALYG